MISNMQQNFEYDKLLKQLEEYKKLENLIKEGRARVERKILQIIGSKLNEKGVNHIDDTLKITTGINETWNQDKLNKIYYDFLEGNINLPYFPFDILFSPNKQKLDLLKEYSLKTFEKIFSDALAITPKKPTFEIKK